MTLNATIPGQDRIHPKTQVCRTFLLSIYYDNISEMHSNVRNPNLASVSFDCVKPKCVKSKLTMTNWWNIKEIRYLMKYLLL